MKLFSTILGAALIASPMVFSTASAVDGATVFKTKGCMGCHGADAKGGMGGMAPMLAGLKESYILEQFKLIRDGKRTSGQAGMMKGAVAAVTDEEAAAAAKYLSGL